MHTIKVSFVLFVSLVVSVSLDHILHSKNQSYIHAYTPAHVCALQRNTITAIEEDFIGEEVSVDGGDDFDFDEDDEDDDDDDISIELANLNRKLIEDISLRDEQIQRLLREEQKQTIFIDKLQKSLQALEEDKTTLQNDVFVLEGITKANSSLEVRAKHAEDAQQALEKQNRGLARQTRLLQGDKADFEEEQKQWEEERGLLRDRLVKAKAQAALLAHAGVNTPEQERVRLEMQVEWEQEKEQTEELRRDLNRVKRSQGKQARQLGEDRRVIEEDRERLARELEMHEKKKRQLRGDFEQIEREKANLEHEKKQSKRSRDALAQERRKIEQGRKRITELSLLSGSPDLLKMEEERIQLDVERTRVQHDRGKLRALEGEVQEAQQRMQAREERLRELQSKVDADLAQQAAFQDKALKLEFERKQFSAEKTMLEQERTTLAAQKMKLAEERKSKSEHVPKELQEKLKVFKHSQKQLEREAEKLAVVKRKMEKEKKQLEEEKALLLHVKTTKLTPEEQSFVELKRETDRMDNILVALGAAPVPAYVNQQEDPIEQIKKEPIRIEITVSARNLIYMVCTVCARTEVLSGGWKDGLCRGCNEGVDLKTRCTGVEHRYVSLTMHFMCGCVSQRLPLNHPRLANAFIIVT